MAKPNEPKDAKPKVEDKDKQKKDLDTGVKMVLINIVSTVLICILFLSVNYFLQSSLLTSKMSQNTPVDSETIADDGGEGEVAEKGLILDLGDFILNLTDVSPRKYLKVNVALEVTKSAADLAHAEAPPAKSGGHGAPAESPDPMKAVEAEMAQYKPAIRDAVITTLSSKTAAEVATVAGKELAKEQIAESVNAIFAGEREVLRVSFGQFIIQ